jgi:hypothetical protein
MGQDGQGRRHPGRLKTRIGSLRVLQNAVRRQGCLFLLRLRLGLLLLLGGLLMRLGRWRNRSAFHSLGLRESFGGQSLELFGIITRPTLARLERQRE